MFVGARSRLRRSSRRVRPRFVLLVARAVWSGFRSWAESEGRRQHVQVCRQFLAQRPQHRGGAQAFTERGDVVLDEAEPGEGEGPGADPTDLRPDWMRALDEPTQEELDEAEQAPAVNAPPVRWTLGADFENVLGDGFGSVLLRHTTGYDFASGVNVGTIPTFETVDVSLGYELPWPGMEARLQADNLFTCRSLEQTTAPGTGGFPVHPPQLDDDQAASELDGSHACGFDVPHVEMVNMPGIETTVFLGLRWSS